MRFTPKIDKHLRERETLIPCFLCAPASPRRACQLCRGAGMISQETAKAWRDAHPLPPMNMPPKK